MDVLNDLFDVVERDEGDDDALFIVLFLKPDEVGHVAEDDQDVAPPLAFGTDGVVGVDPVVHRQTVLFLVDVEERVDRTAEGGSLPLEPRREFGVVPAEIAVLVADQGGRVQFSDQFAERAGEQSEHRVVEHDRVDLHPSRRPEGEQEKVPRENADPRVEIGEARIDREDHEQKDRKTAEGDDRDDVLLGGDPGISRGISVVVCGFVFHVRSSHSGGDLPEGYSLPYTVLYQIFLSL